MTITYIRVSGCDDCTTALVDLTPEQAEGIRLMADAINANSHYGCMPTMRVGEPTPEQIAVYRADLEERREDYADE